MSTAKRHYLSGPMSGYVDHNIPFFNAVARALRSGGLTVVNPAELCPGVTGWTQCMRTDIKALCDCDVLVLLPGWQESRGAQLELHLAHRLGLRIVHVMELLPVLPCQPLPSAMQSEAA